MFSCSGNLATMASGLPYAIAAAVAYPGRQVVAFVGDGGFTMLMGELATCVKYKLPSRSSSSRTTRSARSSGSRWCSSATRSTAATCSRSTSPALRAPAAPQASRSTTRRPAATILREALAHAGPGVIEAVVDPYEPPMPPKVDAGAGRQLRRGAGQGTPHAARSR